MSEITTVIKTNLETNNIYLDTTVFKSANFHYDSQPFKQLLLLSEKEKIKLFITSITVREVKSHISRDIEKAISTIKHNRSDARILRNISGKSYKWLFEDIDKKETFNQIYSLFEDFIKDANVEILPIASLDVEEIFDKYFSFQPPFSDGKKKNEFPDAFVAQAISEWCEENNKSMYIVSSDNDMATTCSASKHLFSLGKIEELLNLVSFVDVNISTFASSAFRHCVRDIKDSIKEEFESLGFILKDEDGDVENINVVSINIIGEYLIYADENLANFNIDVDIEFNADISFNDPNDGYWDGENGIYVSLSVIQETVSRTVSLSSEVNISYNIEEDIEDGAESAYLESVEIDQKDIEVLFDESYPRYK